MSRFLTLRTSTPIHPNQARGVRVIAVASAVVTLSAVDLMLTHTLMATSGLHESNPIARVVAGEGPVALAAFKAASLVVFLAIVVPLRSRAVSELAAWIGLGLLCFVSSQWALYLQETLSAYHLVVGGDMAGNEILVQFNR